MEGDWRAQTRLWLASALASVLLLVGLAELDRTERLAPAREVDPRSPVPVRVDPLGAVGAGLHLETPRSARARPG